MSTVTAVHTREQWLRDLVNKVRPWFDEIEHPLPEKIHVSVGYAKRAGKDAIGWCYHSSVSEDGGTHIFISPEIKDYLEVAATLIHELCHAADDCSSGHGAAFGKIARAIGLEGRLTHTGAGSELLDKLVELRLPPYPHAAMNLTASAVKQPTRMIKVECWQCGYTVRTTQRWISQGLPTCPCGEEMELS